MSRSAPAGPEEILARLAKETGRLLGQIGVRPEDDRWIRLHAESIASLFYPACSPGKGFLYRLARRAARMAR